MKNKLNSCAYIYVRTYTHTRARAQSHTHTDTFTVYFCVSLHKILTVHKIFTVSFINSYTRMIDHLLFCICYVQFLKQSSHVCVCICMYTSNIILKSNIISIFWWTNRFEVEFALLLLTIWSLVQPPQPFELEDLEKTTSVVILQTSAVSYGELFLNRIEAAYSNHG